MIVTYSTTLEVDDVAWAKEFGVSKVQEDVRNYLDNLILSCEAVLDSSMIDVVNSSLVKKQDKKR